MKQIKLFDPIVGNEEEAAIKKVLKSKFWASGAGVGNVSKFERKFRDYLNCDSCIAVNSGTAALNLALSLSDIKNKEVILPSLSFVSTAHAILINGGIPVFVDVNPQTLCIDPIKIKQAITKRTRVILPVHFAGMPCEMDKITNICRQNNLLLIEDAAHATGAKFNNKKIGTHGMAVCFSFHPVKNLAMPTGGLISLNHKAHKKIKKKLLAKRWCGITNRKDVYYDVKEIGWNYYMNEFSASVGLVQLKKLDKLNKIRQNIAKRYSKELSIKSKMPFSSECVYHFYWILTKNRKKLRQKLNEEGIESGIHYTPIHEFSMYRSSYKLPITENIGKNVVTIPNHPNLTNTNLDRIIKLINKYAE